MLALLVLVTEAVNCWVCEIVTEAVGGLTETEMALISGVGGAGLARLLPAPHPAAEIQREAAKKARLDSCQFKWTT